MTISRRPVHLAFALLSVLIVGAPTVGCTARVESGATSSDEAQGGGGAGGGQGGSAPCTAYAGVGCKPGDTTACASPVAQEDGVKMGCELVPGEVCTTQWNVDDCNTPLVLSFDGAPVEYLTDRDRGFNLSGVRSQITDWPTARTPWLALDRDGNGAIDDGSELFGSMSVLSSGRHAANGFLALRELDADGDGHLTPRDPGFSRLLVWSDRDGDRRSTPDELAPVAAFELLSIDLDYTVDARCDLRGNCEVERASFRYRDAAGVERTGAVVDIHVAAQR